MRNLDKGTLVRSAIESILAQSYRNLELLFIDNGSTDSSLRIAKDFADQDGRVSLFSEPRRGPQFAFNRGLNESRGDLVTFLDSDDVCAPNRIERQVALLRDHPEYGCCHTNGWVIDANGNRTGKLYHSNIVPLPKGGGDGDIFSSLLRLDFILGASMMIRSTNVSSERFDADLIFAEDWEMWLRLARRHKFGYVSEPLYGYRIYSKCLRSLDLNGEDRRFVVRELVAYYRRTRRYGKLARLMATESDARALVYSHLRRRV